MRYLLDTNIWLRAVSEKQTLPREALRILELSDEVFGLSAISLWEVGKKVQIGKLVLQQELSAWFGAALAPNLAILPLSQEIVVKAMQLPNFPNRDPADELIIATAIIHDLSVLTTDTKLKGYRHAQVRHFTPILTDL